MVTALLVSRQVGSSKGGSAGSAESERGVCVIVVDAPDLSLFSMVPSMVLRLVVPHYCWGSCSVAFICRTVVMVLAFAL